MPRELFDKLVAAKNYGAGMANVRQIEFALFDMLLHMDTHPEKDTVNKILNEVRKEVAVAFPPEYNRFANSFSHIFAGGYAAGYYSYKWAEVLSADAFSLFQEKGIFNPVVGNKWLDEVLSRGGSVLQWKASLHSAAVNLRSTPSSANTDLWSPNEHHDYYLERQFPEGSSAASLDFLKETENSILCLQELKMQEQTSTLAPSKNRIHAGCIRPENLQRRSHDPS